MGPVFYAVNSSTFDSWVFRTNKVFYVGHLQNQTCNHKPTEIKHAHKQILPAISNLIILPEIHINKHLPLRPEQSFS